MRPILSLSILCLLIAASTPTHAQAPPHYWSQRFGGIGGDHSAGLAVDAAGNVVLVGSFASTINLGGDDLVSAGNDDIVLARFRPNGSHLWSERFGSTGVDLAEGVAVDTDGNVYITGSFHDTVDFGGGPLTANGADVLVAKFNADGVHQWSKHFGAAVSTSVGRGISWSSSGYVYVTGYFENTVSFGGTPLVSAGAQDMFVAKYNSTTGAFTWSQRFGGADNDWGNAVVADTTLGAVAVGFSEVAGKSQIMVVKDYPYGFVNWIKYFAPTGGGMAYGVAVDYLDDVLVAGYFGGSVDFGGGPLASAGSSDVFLVKLDRYSGSHIWSERFGGTDWDEATGVAVDPSGNVALVGNFWGSIDFGGGPLAGAGYEDIFLATFDSAGAHRWSRGFGSPDYSDSGNAVAMGDPENVLMTADFRQTVDFGGGPLTAAGSDDIVLAAYRYAINSIVDVGNDQGRQVRLTFSRSTHDRAMDPTPVTQYVAFRRVDPLAALAPATDAPSPDADAPAIAGFEYAGSIPAFGDDSYLMIAPTLADSTVALGQHYSAFFIRAATATPTIFFDTPVDSGYSLDNLAPGIPQNLIYANGNLTWDESTAADFDYFSVYGSNANDFGTATVVNYTVGTAMDVSGSPYAFYYVTATDFSGNEGTPGTVNTLTGAGGPPASYVLSVSNFPNPFNPRTTVRYTVPARGPVTVVVYDARGARVATLVDRITRDAGAYAVDWDGHADDGGLAASGVYFARIEQGNATRTKKMVLLK